MTHDDVIVPVNIAVLALTLVVVVALGAQRQLLATPAVMPFTHATEFWYRIPVADSDSG